MRVGVIGGGQLAQMLAQAAEPLGIEVCALVETMDCPAQYAATRVQGDQNNRADMQAFADSVDVLSFEFENVNLRQLAALSLPIHPNLNALAIGQDREKEKHFFVAQGVPTTRFAIAQDNAAFVQAVTRIGTPCVVKTCREGYDGKGQCHVKANDNLDAIWHSFAGQRLLIENHIAFDREVSMIAVRDQDGNIRYYPLSENQHNNGILHCSTAIVDDSPIAAKARQYLESILTALDYVGVMAVEFFQVGDELIANELAPRAHNSGHWTIEGAQTSQFENHIRAVCGLPLGNTAARGHSAMINFIGDLPDIETILAQPNSHFHTYHKTPRAGRKLAHVTLTADSEEKLQRQINQLKEKVEV